uniref:Uncharacterized protein n=1 Tax=Romanomermis culicivorax TaxID=13658 RepID=A0A915KPR8_ROMCU
MMCIIIAIKLMMETIDMEVAGLNGSTKYDLTCMTLSNAPKTCAYVIKKMEKLSSSGVHLIRNSNFNTTPSAWSILTWQSIKLENIMETTKMFFVCRRSPPTVNNCHKRNA